jgi:hypothetical protein
MIKELELINKDYDIMIKEKELIHKEYGIVINP